MYWKEGRYHQGMRDEGYRVLENGVCVQIVSGILCEEENVGILDLGVALQLLCFGGVVIVRFGEI